MRRRRTLRRLLEAGVITVALTLLGSLGLSVDLFSGFQRRATDALFPSAQADPEVVVVGIDNKSIKALGLPPWRRSVHAELANQFAAAGVKTAVWDVVFGGEGLDPADNAVFAESLKQLQAPVLAEQISTTLSDSDPTLREATAEAAPFEPLLDGTGAVVAHAEVTPDPSDGVVRALPAVVDQDGTIVPGLSVAALRSSKGEAGPITIQPDGLQAGGRFVPTEGRHTLRLNWADGLDATDAASVISAIDVLNGTISPAKLRDKVVFVGAVEPTLGDNQLVPIDKSGGIPGVMIHANGLNTMLTASYLEEVSDTATALWIALLVLIVALAVLFLPIWISWLVSLAVGLGYGLIVFFRFDGGSVMNIVYPYIAIVLSYFAALAVRYATETRQRRRVSSLFAEYVPETVARELEESGQLDAHMDGQRLDTSLFFCDLRGFTSLSATLEPTEVRGMLNHFYELLTDAILVAPRHGAEVRGRRGLRRVRCTAAGGEPSAGRSRLRHRDPAPLPRARRAACRPRHPARRVRHRHELGVRRRRAHRRWQAAPIRHRRRHREPREPAVQPGRQGRDRHPRQHARQAHRPAGDVVDGRGRAEGPRGAGDALQDRPRPRPVGVTLGLTPR